MIKRMSSYCFHTPVSIKDCKPLTPGYGTRTPECSKFVCRTLTDECEPYQATFTASVVFQGDFLCVVLYISHVHVALDMWNTLHGMYISSAFSGGSLWHHTSVRHVNLTVLTPPE